MKQKISILLASLVLSLAGCQQNTGPNTRQGSSEESADNMDIGKDEEISEQVAETADTVVLGDERFDEYLPLLEGKRVALFSNHTGIVGDETSGAKAASWAEDESLIHFGVDANGDEIIYGKHILDALIEHDVNVTAIFSPEHGFRGTEDAGGVPVCVHLLL